MVKITGLPSTTDLTGIEVVPVVQAGQTRRTTIDEILSGEFGVLPNLHTATIAAGAAAQDANDAIGELQASLDQMSDTTAQALAAVAGDIEQAKGEVAAIVAEVNATQVDISAVVADVAAVQADVQAAADAAGSAGDAAATAIAQIADEVARAVAAEAHAADNALAGIAEARAAMDTAISDANSAIAVAQGQADAARGEAQAAADDLADEIERAKGDTASIRQSLVSINDTIGGVQISIRDEILQRQSADGLLAGRSTTLEQQMAGAQGSFLNTRIANEEFTRTSQNEAMALRTSGIEASYGAASGAINANPTFTVWLDSQPLPSSWSAWSNGGGVSRISTSRPGYKYALRQTLGANVEGGVAQWGSTGLTISPGWYVMEAEVSLESGTWRGAGLTIEGQYGLDFASEPDTNGTASATQTGLRRFSKLVYVEQARTNWHLMSNWYVFGQMDAKVLTWYRSVLRPASQAEITAQKASVDIGVATARLNSTEFAKTTATEELAYRAQQLEASRDGINARLNGTEFARTTATEALAIRAGQLEAARDGINARLNSTEFARTTATDALATSISSLSIGSPNLLSIGGFSAGLEGWNYINSGLLIEDLGWGPRFVMNGLTGVAQAILSTQPDNYIAVSENVAYTVSADLMIFANTTAAFVYVDVIYHSADKTTVVYDSGETALHANADFANSLEKRRAYSFTSTPPTGARWAQIRVVCDPAGGTVTAVGARLLKLERGTIATDFSQEAEIRRQYLVQKTDAYNLSYRTDNLENDRDGFNARLNSTEFARTTATEALAIRAGQLEASRDGINARLNSTEFAKTTATEALATRAGQLEAARDGINARLNSAEFARTTALDAVATSVSSLSVGSPNLLSIGGLVQGLSGWDFNNSGFVAQGFGWGTYFIVNSGISGATQAILRTQSDYFVPVTGNVDYTVSADLMIMANTASANVYVDVIYLAADKVTVVLDGGQSPLNASADFANSLAKRRTYSHTDTAPANAAWAQVRVVCDPAGGTITAVGARLIKFERGTIATAYSQEAEARQQYLVQQNAEYSLAFRAGQLEATVNNPVTGVAATTARLNSTEFAKTTATEALAHRADGLEATVNNPVTGVAATTARLNSTEFAKTSATEDLAYRAGLLEASRDGINARLNSTEFARTNALDAVATSISSLSVGSPNLLSIGGFTSGLEGWNHHVSGQITEDLGWGARFVIVSGLTGAAQSILSTQPDYWVSVTPGAAYTVSADLMIFANTASAFVYVDVIYYNSDKTAVVLDGGQAPLYATSDFANSLTKRRAYSFTDTVPTGAAWAQVRIACDPSGGTVSAVGARLIKFERGAIATAYTQEAEARQQYLVRKDAESSLAIRANQLEATVNNPVTGVAATTARLNSTEFAKTTATEALATRANQLEATVNNPVTGVAATTARLNSTEFARSTATEDLAYRAGQLEASRDGINARLNGTEFARTTALDAVATSVSSLSVGSPNLLSIGGFTSGLEGWDHHASGLITEDLGWGARFVIVSGLTGAAQSILSTQPDYWVSVTPGAAYTVSADLMIFANTASAFVYVDVIYYNSDKTAVVLDGGQAPLYATSDFANSLTKRRAYSFTDTVPTGAAWAQVRIACDPAGGTITSVGARLIKFERGAIATAYTQEAEARQQYLVRKDAEYSLAIRANQLEATVNNPVTGVAATTARLNSTEFAKTTATEALATRANQLEATVNNPVTGVAATTARLNSTEFARSTATEDLAYRAQQLEASRDGINARLNSSEFARTTALDALATSVSGLSVGSPNLLAIGGFTSGLEGWNYLSSGVIVEDLGWGPRFVVSAGISGAGVAILSTRPEYWVSVAANATYTISADLLVFANTPNAYAYVDVIYFNSDRTAVVFDGGQTAVHASVDFGSSLAKRRASAFTDTTPTGAAWAQIRVVCDPAGGTVSAVGARLIKFERGAIATDYSQEAEIRQQGTVIKTLQGESASLDSKVAVHEASLTTQQAAINTLNGRNAAWLQIKAVSGDNRAQMTIYADEEHAGIDLDASIRVHGEAVFDQTLTAGKIEANGITLAQQAYNGSGWAGTNSTITDYDFNGDPIYSSGYWSLSFNVVMARPGDIIVIATAKQGYSSGLRSWDAHLTVNGNTIADADGSGGFSDNIAMSGKYHAASAGTYTVAMIWEGADSTISIGAGRASLISLRTYA